MMARLVHALCRRALAALALLLLAASSPPPACAADAPPAVDLVYLNRPIYTMRAVIAGASPELRAARALQRLRALPPRQWLLPIAAAPVDWEGEQAVALRIDDQTLLTVFARDLDAEAGMTLERATATARAQLHDALVARHETSRPEVLLEGAAVSLGGLLVLGTVAALANGLRHALTRRLQTMVEQGAATHRLLGIDWSEYAYRIVGRGMQLLGWAALLLLAHVWLSHSLQQFPVTAPIGDGMRRLTVQLVLDGALALWSVLPQLAMIVFIVLVARACAWLLGQVFDGMASGRLKLPGVHPETAGATRRLAMFAVWGLAVAALYPYIPGSQSDVFRGLSVFVGFMITLGSSGVVAQWMHGLVIVYARALRPGDFVRIGGVEGTVSELGALAVKLVNHRGDEVTLPNGTVTAGPVTNHSKLAREGSTHAAVAVSIGYDVPWRQVHALLHEAARRTPGVRQEPPPTVLQRALSDFYVEYEMLVDLDRQAPRARVMSRLHESVQDVFDQAGVQILSPHYRAHVPAGPPPPPPQPAPGRAGAQPSTATTGEPAC